MTCGDAVLGSGHERLVSLLRLDRLLFVPFKERRLETAHLEKQMMQATFFGDEDFPIEWDEGQKELFWVHDDLHIPNPVSPMYADIGGWWLSCDYMFRRFGTPFASDWLVKIINGYVYTAAIPAKSDVRAVASEYDSFYMG